MAFDLQPSDYVHAFVWDRLIAVAQILFDARQWVAENATPERGDTRTGIGFRAWEHCKHAIEKAAATDLSGWLGIQDKGPKFVFLLVGMPIRFYRGDSEEPVPENYADPEPSEVVQIELALASNAGLEFKGYYRMIVQANAAGFPLAIYLVGVDFNNVIRLAWEIPRAQAGAAPIVVPQSPVPLPPLNVLTVAEASVAEREEQERAEREKAEQEKKDDQTTRGA